MVISKWSSFFGDLSDVLFKQYKSIHVIRCHFELENQDNVKILHPLNVFTDGFVLCITKDKNHCALSWVVYIPHESWIRPFFINHKCSYTHNHLQVKPFRFICKQNEISLKSIVPLDWESVCELCVWPKIMGENTMFKVSAQIDTVNLTLSLRLLNVKRCTVYLCVAGTLSASIKYQKQLNFNETK